MVHFNGKRYDSLEQLLRKKDIFAEDEDKKQIEKLLNKGQNIYCNINPYEEEMFQEGVDEHKRHLIWDTDEDALKETYARMCDDV